MRIGRARIQNFRCLHDVDIEFGPTTVLIGENSAGKTAILEAIRIVLTRRWGQRGTGFAEYDFYAGPGAPDPKASEGIRVLLHFEESRPEEWPEDLTAALNDVVQPDTTTQLNAIILQAVCKYDDAAKAFVTSYEFLNRAGQPLGGKAARVANTNQFFDYVPVFGLSALRDVGQEFSSRSQLWGQLLKRISIPNAAWAPIEAQLSELNAEVLKADPRLDAIRAKIHDVRQVVTLGAAGEVNIRALPMKAWDLIQRAELVVRGAPEAPWLPLDRQGQGVQSLSIIYLFQAFVDQLLHEVYPKHSEPILLLEEPEAHLHPQAARALGREIEKLSGQKIISTHSPYFVEKIALDHVRIVRPAVQGSAVFQLRRKYRRIVPKSSDVAAVATAHPKHCSYDKNTGALTVLGKVDEKLYKKLLKCFPTSPDKDAAHPIIKELRDLGVTLLNDEDLTKLEEWARRVRGEIFFSKLWVLCEGQSEYLLLHSYMQARGFPLDRNGVSVIDYQNNGSPGAFACLARALGFQWLLMCDGDGGGDNHVAQIMAAEFAADVITARVHQLPKPHDVESLLVASPLRAHLLTVGPRLSTVIGAGVTDDELAKQLRDRKPMLSHVLAQDLEKDPTLADQFPQFFSDLHAIIANA